MRPAHFRWNDWNLEHVQKHGATPEDAEYVVKNARSPFPKRREEDKWFVIGQTPSGRYLQVIFLRDPNDDAYIIHAPPLNDREKQRLRRRRR